MPATSPYIDLRGAKLPADLAVIRCAAREAISLPCEIDIELSTPDPAYRR